VRADLHAGAQFCPVKGLRQVIVGSGVKPCDDILFAALSGQENELRRCRGGEGANAAAKLDAVYLRHHPV
jgi:hypothetical protein